VSWVDEEAEADAGASVLIVEHGRGKVQGQFLGEPTKVSLLGKVN
jgi:hypothetical protein